MTARAHDLLRRVMAAAIELPKSVPSGPAPRFLSGQTLAEVGDFLAEAPEVPGEVQKLLWLVDEITEAEDSFLVEETVRAILGLLEHQSEADCPSPDSGYTPNAPMRILTDFELEFNIPNERRGGR